MIGVWAERSRARTSRAVSKPSRPAICTSRSRTAKSSCSRRRRASSPEVSPDQMVAGRLEDRLQGHQIGRLVVDQQDADRRGAGLVGRRGHGAHLGREGGSRAWPRAGDIGSGGSS